MGKSCWPIFPLAGPILCATSVTDVFRQFFEIHTLAIAERKTFQCGYDTTRHYPMESRRNGSENCVVALY